MYQPLLEGLYLRALAGRIPPSLRDALRNEGLDLDALPTSVSVPTFIRCLELTARTLYPERSLDEGTHELGRQLALSVWRMPLGRAMAGMLRLLGPRRSLEWLTRLFRSLDSHSEIRAQREGPRQYRIETNSPDAPAGYSEAVFEEILRVAGADSPRARTLHLTSTSATYRVWWD
ncbi:MAG TPA: DUF2378 family protein [Myxococcaceae bacterium]|nr:DUF2378 family protein [Myxococcaceae bacterium]